MSSTKVPEITVQLKVTMLKLLVSGRDLGFVAMAVQLPRDRVLDVVSDHGYPDRGRMQWAVDVLLEGSNEIPEQSHISTGAPLDRPVDISHRQKVLLDAQSTTHRPPVTQARPVHTSTAEILHQAGESTAARTRALGAKISTLLADLTGRLADEQAALEVKHQAEKENAAVTARIAQLEAEIRKLKGKTPKKTASSKQAAPRSGRLDRGVYPCTTPECDRTFDTPQGASSHRRRAHEGWSPRSSGAV